MTKIFQSHRNRCFTWTCIHLYHLIREKCWRNLHVSFPERYGISSAYTFYRVVYVADNFSHAFVNLAMPGDGVPAPEQSDAQGYQGPQPPPHRPR